MKHGIAAFSILLSAAFYAVGADTNFAVRLDCELQTAGPASLKDVNWTQGQTPLMELRVLRSGRPISADTNTSVRMLFASSQTATAYAVATNYWPSTNASSYFVQWGAIGTNTAGTGTAARAWFYTVYFDKISSGETYWSGNGEIYIEKSTSLADGLNWIAATNLPRVAWPNVLGDPSSNQALADYLAQSAGEDSAARAGVASNAASIVAVGAVASNALPASATNGWEVGSHAGLLTTWSETGGLASASSRGGFAGTETIAPLAVFGYRYGRDAGSNAVGTNWFAAGQDAGRNANGDNWLAVGHQAGMDATGYKWTALGLFSGQRAESNQWTAVGPAAGRDANGEGWVAVGHGAGEFSTGEFWTATGTAAGYGARGNLYTANGYYAGYLATGNGFTAIGSDAGRGGRGTNWTAVGRGAGAYSTGTRWGAFGDYSGYGSTGDYWIALGNYCGRFAVLSNSAAIGQWAGRSATGSNRLYIDVYDVDSDPGANGGTNDVIFSDNGNLNLGRTGPLGAGKSNELRGNWTINGDPIGSGISASTATNIAQTVLAAATNAHDGTARASIVEVGAVASNATTAAQAGQIATNVLSTATTNSMPLIDFGSGGGASPAPSKSIGASAVGWPILNTNNAPFVSIVVDTNMGAMLNFPLDTANAVDSMPIVSGTSASITQLVFVARAYAAGGSEWGTVGLKTTFGGSILTNVVTLTNAPTTQTVTLAHAPVSGPCVVPFSWGILATSTVGTAVGNARFSVMQARGSW